MLRPASRRHGGRCRVVRTGKNGVCRRLRSELVGAGRGSRPYAAWATHRRVMRLGPAARVAATATGIIVVVYVLGVIVLNLVVSARLAQQNDNRLADRLAAASDDPDVVGQRAPHVPRRG